MQIIRTKIPSRIAVNFKGGKGGRKKKLDFGSTPLPLKKSTFTDKTLKYLACLEKPF